LHSHHLQNIMRWKVAQVGNSGKPAVYDASVGIKCIIILHSYTSTHFITTLAAPPSFALQDYSNIMLYCSNMLDVNL